MMRRRADRWPIVLGMLTILAWAGSAQASKVAWMDEIVQQAVREARAEGKVAARGVDGVATRGASRLFAREADESLELLARRSDDLARTASPITRPADAALDSRFRRMVQADPETLRTFRALPAAEKRLVVEMGETAQRLARRYPGQAEPLIQRLGVEGMTAVRVYGDDAARVIAREGPQSIDVLRKTGRGGWAFYTGPVLRNKQKLAAAGVLALFLANPDQFVDSAGRITEYAVEQFARAGIDLAGAVSGGAARGLENSIGNALAAYGLDSALLRKLGMAGAALVAVLALMVVLGLPVAWLFRPVLWPVRLLRRRMTRAV
ncbi:hypothetical protein BH23PLA1_BH23PLA1_34630 [soil metagenome]